MSGYLGPQPVPQATQHRQTVTANAGLTSITTSGYQPGYVDVYMNGVKLVNGTDYTATDGASITLASAANANDIIEIIANVPFQLVGMTFTGTTTFNGPVNMPTWTTAGRPSSPQIGTIGYNTTIGALENYTSQGWLKVNVTIPAITGTNGTIYSGVTSTITFTGLNFGVTSATVTFTSGATTATATGTPTGGGTSLAVSVPASIYALSAGASVTATITNGDNVTSAASSAFTVVGLPSGGTITTSGGNRIHTFLSSGTLTVPTNFSATANYLVVAGGGGAGTDVDVGGGGGGGGLLTGTVSLTSQTYSVVVGAGGSGGSGPDSTGTGAGTNGAQGGNSSAFGLTAIGGGYGGTRSQAGGSGGSGGGGGDAGGLGGSGTSGQGYAGGNAPPINSNGGWDEGGGGGAGGAAVSYTPGPGLYVAMAGATFSAGGRGASISAGAANTGNGGNSCRSGGSGIVIISYPLPT
jgi:hypothetical protein